MDNPKKNRYAYRLEGLETDWVQCGNRNFVNYTNLPPGNYIFRVKGAGSKSNWNEEGLSLKIRLVKEAQQFEHLNRKNNSPQR